MLQREARIWATRPNSDDRISLFTLVGGSLGLVFILAGVLLYVRDNNLQLKFDMPCSAIEIDNAKMDHGSYRKNHSPSWRPGH